MDILGGDTGDSAISGSSNRAPGPLSTKGGRLGTRARLLVCRNPYGQRKITAPGDAGFLSARALRVFGAVFGGVGREGGALIRRGTRSFDQHVPDLGLGPKV